MADTKSALLYPHDQVQEGADPMWRWQASDTGARFVLRAKAERGWYRISWRGRAEMPLQLKLSIDYGEGFYRNRSLVFGGLDDEEKRQSQYIPIDGLAQTLRLDVGNGPSRFDLEVEEWSPIPSFAVQLVTLAGLLRTPDGRGSLLTTLADGSPRQLLERWRRLRRRALYDRFQFNGHQRDTDEVMAEIAGFSTRPLVSVLMPCYNTEPRWLREAVDSVRGQFYPDWELVLVDDGSTNSGTIASLTKLEGADPRIRVLWQKRNGGISAATNAALQAAGGDLVALLDHDDTLTPDALFEVVRRFNQSPELDVVFTDQDKIDESGQLYQPFYKPDWSPEFFRGVMFVGHLLVVRRKLALAAGGFDSRFDKVQDFEFMLRVSERTERIGHVPKVLYHWRAVPGSVARAEGEKSGITRLQAAAVSAHLARVGVNAVAAPHPEYEHRVVLKPRASSQNPLVSIIIPTKDAPRFIGPCLDSIFERSTYPRFEVIVVDNGTTHEQALAAIHKYPVQAVPLSRPFNFSIANNLGAEHAKGDVLILLNNDTEVIDPDWIETLVFYVMQSGVGAVGPLLVYPDRSIQHAGVVLGVRGTADHVMRHLPASSDGYSGSLSCAREVSAVTAACLAIRREEYLAVGGLVDHYATHYQDLDLCLRIRELGKRILFVPRARLYHHESASRGPDYDQLDRALLLDTWSNVIERGDPYYNPNFSLERFDYSLREDAPQ